MRLLEQLPDPDSETGVSFPAQGEKLRVGDVSQINGDERVQKALKRLAADKAPATVSQLVMRKLTSGKDWASIEQLSSAWANAHELSLAREFVDRLDSLPEYETGTVLFAIEGVDAAGKAMTAALTKELGEKVFLGLRPKLGVPDQPEGPAVACRVRLEPEGLWPNFAWGQCAYRLQHYDDAVAAFSVCVGAAPGLAESYFNRALAYAALGRVEPAVADYDRALQL